ncbi:hypothetical protein SAMN04487910_4054 [Aquimarina amphilecti]|uniref:Uncharacterized protein n=1 Tax=Aquimarina amphilecti TaxID=1038014 RepID=A0A1H7VDX1_AQUAM|nr:hypothetical protein [Aquimarina amphilecti]SEM07254.1 hypothetical protein SAMN04487910_4054 [Aquimarina amphilecti]
MKRTILFIVVAVLCSNIQAQNRIDRSRLTPVDQLFRPLDYKERDSPGEIENVSLEGAIGSPYEDKVFRQGELVDLSFEKKVIGMFVRYNVYTNEVELVKHPESKNVSAMIKADKVFARIGSQEYHYKEYNDANNKPKKGYLIKLRCNSKINVYKELTKTFVHPKVAQTSYHKNEPAKFMDHEKYYMEIDGKMVYLKMNKRKIVKSFPGKQSELKSYINKEKLSFKKEVDLVRLVAYYDTL